MIHRSIKCARAHLVFLPLQIIDIPNAEYSQYDSRDKSRFGCSTHKPFLLSTKLWYKRVHDDRDALLMHMDDGDSGVHVSF